MEAIEVYYCKNCGSMFFPTGNLLDFNECPVCGIKDNWYSELEMLVG